MHKETIFSRFRLFFLLTLILTFSITLTPVTAEPWAQLAPRDLAPRDLIALQNIPGNPGSNFGATVALDGDTVAVGASGEESATNFDSGAVYIYIRDGFEWVPQQTILDDVNANGLFFGEALALDGDTLAISSYYRDDSAGAVYVYTRTAGVWSLQAELTAADRAMNDLFGVSVALDGDTLAISAQGADTPNGVDSGAVYIFTRTAGVWTQQAKLLPGTAGMQAGRSLALSSGTLFVGSPSADSANVMNSGQVTVYTGVGPTWVPRVILTPSDPVAEGRFGLSLSYEAASGRVAIGAPGLATLDMSGAVYLFTGSGGTWTQQIKLTPNNAQGGQTFGDEVGLNEQRLLIGAPNYDSTTQEATGAVYQFSIIGSNWVEQQFITGTNAAELGYFGAGLAIGPEWSVIGSGGETTSISLYRDIATGEELLVNGSFELADSTDPKLPLGWTQSNPSNDKRKCTDAATRAYQGVCTYKFTSRADERSKLTQNIDPVAVNLMAGDTLVLDGFVRANGDAVVTQIKAVVEYPDGSSGKASAKLRQATSGFTSLGNFSNSLTLSLTQTPVSVKVMIKNRGTSGKVLYDGLSLYRPPSGRNLDLLPLP